MEIAAASNIARYVVCGNSTNPKIKASSGLRIPTALAATNPAATKLQVAELPTNSAITNAELAPMNASGKICPPYQPPAKQTTSTKAFSAVIPINWLIDCESFSNS